MPEDHTHVEQDQHAWDRWRQHQYATSPYPAPVVDNIIEDAKAAGISGVDVQKHNQSVDQLRVTLRNLEAEPQTNEATASQTTSTLEGFDLTGTLPAPTGSTPTQNTPRTTEATRTDEATRTKNDSPDYTASDLDQRDQRAWTTWRQQLYEELPFPSASLSGLEPLITKAQSLGISGVEVLQRQQTIADVRELVTRAEYDQETSRETAVQTHRTAPTTSTGGTPNATATVTETTPPAGPTPSVLTPALKTDGFKVGLLGGKGVGKSYLFQSLVYRLYGVKTGAIRPYIQGNTVELFRSNAGTALSAQQTHAFIEEYRHWRKLQSTTMALQRFYHLRVPLVTGWLGRTETPAEVMFLDGSGEGFEGGIVTDDDRTLWKTAYGGVRVMVFCLPMWAAFPTNQEDWTDEQLEERDAKLAGFERVRNTYKQLRDDLGETGPVTVIVALTMADDRRCAGPLQDNWITTYTASAKYYLRQLKRPSGIPRYLASAKQISTYLLDQCEDADEPIVQNLRGLHFGGGGDPWLLPVTAVDGEHLEFIGGLTGDVRTNAVRRVGDPIPAHAELPLLVAICDRYNALA